MSIPSMSLGIESLKKWVDYWRKFKGKEVRIWFIRKDRDSIAQYNCKTDEQVCEELEKRGVTDISAIQPDLYEPVRLLEACTCVEGKISDVVDSPFGIMLTRIRFWKVYEPKSKNDYDLTIGERNTEIKQMFIPMSEIARIDFLTESNW